jgi:hypothetical protein
MAYGTVRNKSSFYNKYSPDRVGKGCKGRVFNLADLLKDVRFWLVSRS